MKIHALYGFIALLTLGVASCGKSTTGKITNNWGIVSSEEERTYVDNGAKNYIKTSFTETTITTYSETTPPTGSPNIQESVGKVTANTLNIKEDGTWIWNQERSYEGNQGGMWVQTNLKTIQSGTWSFAAKTKGDDFKKNERVVFNVLSKTANTVQTQNNVLVANEENISTFLTGENMLIYTIVKSKSKELQLKLEKSSQSIINSDVTSDKLTENMTLKEI